MGARAWRAAFLAVAMAGGWPAHGGKTAAIDARQARLGDVVRLLMAQGAPRVVVSERIADREVTFAAKGISPAAALRWLLRVEKLLVEEDEKGRLALSPPGEVQSLEKNYKVTKLAPTKEAADGLVAFIERTILRLYPHREADEDGTRLPRLEVECEQGKLQVVAPLMVQREVVALLNTLVAARSRRGYKQVAVRYRPTEIGFLCERNAPPAPKLDGQLELEAGSVEAWEAAWRLARAAGISFYVDPWDDALVKAQVRLAAGKRSLEATVSSLREQLGARLRWYDGAWVFCRQGREALFGDYLMRVYNLSGTGPFVRSFVGITRNLVRPRSLPSSVPSAFEQVGEDLWLLGAPSAWHDPLEEFLKRPAEPWRRPGWRDRGPGRWPGRGRW